MLMANIGDKLDFFSYSGFVMDFENDFKYINEYKNKNKGIDITIN